MIALKLFVLSASFYEEVVIYSIGPLRHIPGARPLAITALFGIWSTGYVVHQINK